MKNSIFLNIPLYLPWTQYNSAKYLNDSVINILFLYNNSEFQLLHKQLCFVSVKV